MDKDSHGLEVFFDVQHGLPRQGPGNDESTRRALEMLYGAGLEDAGKEFRVLDIGCGNGAQTLRLAVELGCRVTAVDNHRLYLDELMRRAETQGLAARIETRLTFIISASCRSPGSRSPGASSPPAIRRSSSWATRSDTRSR